MPIRSRIALLFAVLVMIILGLVCGGIYYFSYTARENTLRIRLTNRSLSTARLLAQKEIFDQRLVQRIDSLTTISLKHKTVQAYDYQNRKVYSYSDLPADTLEIAEEVLDNARVNGSYFFTIKNKEAVAYHYSDPAARLVVVCAAEDIEGKQSLHTLFNILMLSFFIGNAFVLITGYIFSARLLLPVKKIAADVEDISAQNLARRIKTGTANDEWHQLATTLNGLLNRLQESFNLQRIFISNASHELSTPLTSISSQLEVALQRERDASEYRRIMQSIYQDVRHMSKLTQTLLEFAKASGDPAGLEISPVRIDEVLLRLPSEMAKLNPQYSVSLSFNNLPEDEEQLHVYGNEALLFTATRNIVLNACKYSADHRATIILTAANDSITVIISDQGKGIPANELDTIFQPFYRLAENHTSEGFGLGLSLADRIIKLHKGRISVSSVINVGTTFTIVLPSAKSLR